MFFNIIHDLLLTMPNYVHINLQRQQITDFGEEEEEGANEQADEGTNERTHNFQSRAKPLGGYAGIAEALALATELQADGT